MKQNPPNKHHYIPEFYQRRWIKKDSGQLLVFSRPYKEVIERRSYPSQTGYEYRLYELKGFHPDVAQQVEERFFRPVDSSASDALTLMEKHGNRLNWNNRLRSAWTRYILSLLFRCPEDIVNLRSRWGELLSKNNDLLELKYLELKKPEDPKSFADWLINRPTWRQEKDIFQLFMTLVDNKEVGSLINDMYWYVLDTSEEKYELLTSDRPVILTDGLQRDDGHLALPIGPKKLFIATFRRKFAEELLKLKKRDIVMECNRQVVRGAIKFVYAHNPTQHEINFILAQFGTEPRTRMIERTVSV